MDYLDEGVLTEILMRLPAKSLLRFKCVNRLWHSVIADPAFAKAQLRMSLQGSPNPSEKLLVHANRKYDLDESIFTRLNNRVTDQYGYLSIVGSCHGLVCLQATDWRQFFVYNPTTRELRELPMSDSLRYPDWGGYASFVCGFGYDARKDDYKLLVRFRCYWGEQTELVVIYSLRSNSWRSISEVNDYCLLSHGRYSNGFLHWLGWRMLDPTIISFDIATEEFREAMSPMPPRLRHGHLRLSVTGGGSLIMYRIDHPKAEVWIMKVSGLNSTWSELCHFSNEQLGKEYVMFTSDYISPLTKDGKALLCVRRERDSVDLYDPEDGFLKTFQRLSPQYGITTYVESLVSVQVATRPPEKARLSN